MNQARGDEQGDSVEYAVDEKRLAQFECAWRYLQCIGNKRCEREHGHQRPQQSSATGKGGHDERDTVNHRHVELQPRTKIQDDSRHCDRHRESGCRAETDGRMLN